MKDKMKNILVQYGYGMIALPKATIKPFQLLVMEGKYYEAIEGAFTELFEPDIKPAPPIIDGDIANIVGQDAIKLDASLGLNFMENIFKSLGLVNSKIAFNTEANKDKKLVFSFENVKEDKIDHIDLDNYLTGAIPVEGQFRTFEEKLKNSELYIISSVLKSSSISISLENANGQKASFEGGLSEIVDSKINITRNKSDGYTISSASDTTLVFAYKAVQILYDKAKWFQFWKPQEAQFRIKNATGPTVKGDETEFPVKYLDMWNQ